MSSSELRITLCLQFFSEAPEEPAKEPVPAAAPGFEVIDKESVPAPDSAEVKDAVSAQGEDGSLLVDFVQVSKDDIPPAAAVEPAPKEPEMKEAAPEVPVPETNGIKPCIPHGGKRSCVFSLFRNEVKSISSFAISSSTTFSV